MESEVTADASLFYNRMIHVGLKSFLMNIYLTRPSDILIILKRKMVQLFFMNTFMQLIQM
jgi:hypothetical protein